MVYMIKQKTPGKPIRENGDPFDIWMTLGIIVAGRTRDLELLLSQIKNNPDLRLVFTKTSAGKLTIKETDRGVEYLEK